MALHEVEAARPGFYVVRVDRPAMKLPLLRLRILHDGARRGEPAVLPALPRTEYLLRTARGDVRLLFDEADVTAASVRPAHIVDILRAAERPRVAARLRLSLGKDLTVRPLLRGTGKDGRALAKVMRAMKHWGFGLDSANLRQTPELLDSIDPARLAGIAPRVEERPRFVVALHLFYEDLWPEFAVFLSRISQPFHLIVTTPLVASSLSDDVRRVFPSADVVVLPNHGRDVWPFLHLLGAGAFDRYEFVLKLHGKRTGTDGYRATFGHVWRRACLLDLAGSDETVRSILGRFDEKPDIGMIGSPRFRLPGHLMAESEAWGGNRNMTLELARRLGMDATAYKLDFYAGTMFWARRSALEPLRPLGIRSADFLAESGQRDGGLEHAFERVFGAVPGLVGMDLEDALPYARAALRRQSPSSMEGAPSLKRPILD